MILDHQCAGRPLDEAIGNGCRDLMDPVLRKVLSSVLTKDHILTMKPLRISEDIVPIGEFKAQAARWLKRAHESSQPVVITQNGKPAAVLVSPMEYDRLQERERFLQSVAAGLEDAEGGRVMPASELKARLAGRRTKKRSA